MSQHTLRLLRFTYKKLKEKLTVSDSKKLFHEQFTFVIPGLYKKIVDELLVELSQRKDELLKLQKQKIINLADKKSIEIDLFNSKLRSPIDGFILAINTRVGERPKNEGILEIGSSQNMEALIEVYESDIDRVFISQDVLLSSENGGFNKTLKGQVIRISPKVKQRKVLSTDPTGDADARIIEVLVQLNEESINVVRNYAGMKVIAKFQPL